MGRIGVSQACGGDERLSSHVAVGIAGCCRVTLNQSDERQSCIRQGAVTRMLVRTEPFLYWTRCAMSVRQASSGAALQLTDLSDLGLLTSSKLWDKQPD